LQLLGIAHQIGSSRRLSQLSLLPHYGNAGHRKSRWELSFGNGYRVTPNIIFGKAPKSPPPRNADQASRTREHLTPEKIERMIAAAQVGAASPRGMRY
jgi:hypothetical protein